MFFLLEVSCIAYIFAVFLNFKICQHVNHDAIFLPKIIKIKKTKIIICQLHMYPASRGFFCSQGTSHVVILPKGSLWIGLKLQKLFQQNTFWALVQCCFIIGNQFLQVGYLWSGCLQHLGSCGSREHSRNWAACGDDAFCSFWLLHARAHQGRISKLAAQFLPCSLVWICNNYSLSIVILYIKINTNHLPF